MCKSPISPLEQDIFTPDKHYMNHSASTFLLRNKMININKVVSKYNVGIDNYYLVKYCKFYLVLKIVLTNYIAYGKSQ